MRDESKTKHQLLTEIAALRSKIKELESNLDPDTADSNRIIVENTSQGLAIFQDKTVVFANQAFSDMSGYTLEELIGLTPRETLQLIHQDDQTRVIEWLTTLEQGHTEFSRLEYRFVSKNGDIWWVEPYATVIEFRSKPALQISFVDITQCKKAEQALRESEEKFSQIFQLSPDAIVILSAEGKYLDVNQAYSNRYGYTQEDIIGKTPNEMGVWVYPEERERFHEKALVDGHVYAEELHFRDRYGNIFTVLMSAEPITLNGNPCLISVSTDITNRVKSEQALQESEEKFAAAFHASPDAMAISTTDGKFFDVNNAFVTLFEYSRDEVLGKVKSDFNQSKNAEQEKRLLELLRKDGRIFSEECEFKTKSGKIRTVLFSLENVTLAGEKCAISVSTDITARKQAERALQESEEKFATAFHASPDAIVILDENGTYIDVNESFARVTGYSREELIGKNETDFDTFLNDEVRNEILQRLATEGSLSDYEYQVPFRDKSIHTVLFSIKPITLAGKYHFLVVIHDITERKRAIAALEESEERFAIAFHSNPDMAIITGTKQGIYYEVNDSFCRNTGYEREELIGRTADDINLWETREEKLRFEEEVRKSGRVRLGEYRFRIKNGEIRTWLYSAEFIMLHGVTCMLAVATDITERIEAEQQLKNLYEKEASLRQKLEEEIQRRAEFTRALVHELKTPLTPIVASSDSLAAILTEEPLKSMAANVNRGALNLNKRIDELLELARSELNILQISPVLTDLSDLIRDIVSEMNQMATDRQQTLKLELPDQLTPVLADPERIRQVVSNLITNAIKFTQDGGQIFVRAGSTKKKVIIEVQDTGPGLDEEDLDKLFQPYYRKASDRDHLSGLGLGLTLCKTLIDLHGGKIWAASESGKGSTFSFSLPVPVKNTNPPSGTPVKENKI